MKRIIPEQVVEAYLERGWEPVRNHWANVLSDGKPCGCGLGVLIGDEIHDLFGSKPTTPVYAIVAERLGLERDYVWGFTVGFDGGGKPNQKHHRPVAAQGIEDGRAAWEAVEREVLSR